MGDALKQSKNLIFFTILYNLVEGIFAISVGVNENSTALLSFGMDSFIEIFASGVALVGLSNSKTINEKTAERYISYSFIFLIFFIKLKSLFFNDLHCCEIGHLLHSGFVGLQIKAPNSIND